MCAYHCFRISFCFAGVFSEVKFASLLFVCDFSAFFLCFSGGLLPVGLNSLRSGLAWSPAASVPPRFAVAVEGRVIHFLRRVGGFVLFLLCFKRRKNEKERGRALTSMLVSMMTMATETAAMIIV